MCVLWYVNLDEYLCLKNISSHNKHSLGASFNQITVTMVCTLRTKTHTHTHVQAKTAKFYACDPVQIVVAVLIFRFLKRVCNLLFCCDLLLLTLLFSFPATSLPSQLRQDFKKSSQVHGYMISDYTYIPLNPKNACFHGKRVETSIAPHLIC